MKRKRQEKLLSLISERDIETQEELCSALKEAGFAVTQATVSRDIRELRITKIPMENGGQRYSARNRERSGNDDRNQTILREAVVSVDTAGNLLVIKCVSGMAMAVAAAIDSMDFQEIVGSIAGDDTVMCALKSEKNAEILMRRIINIC